MTDEYLEMAARAVDGGAVAVVPTDTVYGIGTGAFASRPLKKFTVLKNARRAARCRF
jgi:tRNA A37 threonylcarbamoyladenosine synthetase subunit TsaC/SUA5/YrdC